MRLIDAECLCDLVEQSSILSAGFKQVFEKLVAGEPAVDAVPVVRCRDCKHLVNATVNANGFLICGVSDMEIAPEDFCSYGEREEEQNGRT